jgi:hypothetical protein
MAALALQHREEIIAELALGKRLSDICQVYDITPAAISKVLNTDPEYIAAIEEGHRAKLDKAETMIEEAYEQVNVARARAYWSAVSWRAEREAAHRWGQRTTLDLNHSGPLVQISVSLPQQTPDTTNIIEHDDS